METTSEISKKESALIGALFLVLLIVCAFAIVPKWRTQIKNFFIPQNRIVLSTVSGMLTPQGPVVKVLKISSNQSLQLEVYQVNNDGEIENLLMKLPLAESKDGYFTFKGNATNLALSDIDNDGTLEILTATFDDESTPRLSIFKYNPQTQGFEKMSAPPKFSN